MTPVRPLVLALRVFVLLLSLKLFQLKGYEGSDDSGDGTHREGATEDTQENPNRREKCRGIEHVCVRPSGLVGHNRPETSRKPQQPYRNGEDAQQADGGGLQRSLGCCTERALISGAISHRPPGGAASLWRLQLPHICISTSSWEQHNLAKELHRPYDESTMATASFMTLSPNSRA